jgi:pimeloyl-ACP methyl ester carboxylesterase
VLNAEKAAPASVWGYSWGAHLAFALATIRSDVVSRLVLGGHDPTKGLALFRATLGRRTDALRRGGFDEYWRVAGWGPDAAGWDGLSYNDPLAHAAMLEGRKFEGDLSSLAVPTLLYVGEHDGSSAGVLTATVAKRHRVVRVPGLDHAGAADASEMIIPIVRPFLLEGAGPA